MKKLLLSIGSVAAATAPITAIIACNETTSKSKSDQIAAKLDVTFAKQNAEDFVLKFVEDKDNKIAEGTYYFTKDQLKKGEEITVASTVNGETTKLKVKTDIAAGDDKGASLETTGNAPVVLTAETLEEVKPGDTEKFVLTDKDEIAILADINSVAKSLEYFLYTKVKEELFEENKADIKAVVNKVLKDIGKEIKADDAFTFTKPEIIINIPLATTAVDEDKTIDKFGLSLAKQATTDFVLNFVEDTDNKIAEGTYYFTKDQLKEGEEITVASTDADETTKLKVTTAIASGDDKGASLETTGTTKTPVIAGTLEKVTAGVASKFVATETDGFAKPLEDEAAVIKEIKKVVNSKLEEKFISKEELEKSINQLLIVLGKKLDTKSLTILNTAVAIDGSKIEDIA